MKHRLLAALLVLACSSPALAKVYQIEMIIFAYNNAQAGWDEHWPTDLALSFPARTLQFGSDLNANSNYRLNNTMGNIDKQQDMTVLFHKAWKQDLSNRSSSPAIQVQGGQQFFSHYELEGWVKFSLERYLHIETNLWLSKSNSNIPHIDQKSSYGDIVDSSESSSMLGSVGNQTVVLRQSRRMKSNEAHYLDHPLMGVLTIITPLDK